MWRVKDIIGQQSSKTALVEKIISANALNQTGDLHYNKYGVKDRIGLMSCSNIFIDNFILSVLIPDTTLNGRKFKYVDVWNTYIRKILTTNGFTRCSVKAIGCEQYTQRMTEEDKKKVAYKSEKASKYFWQNYKVACSDEDLTVVMSFLRGEKFRDDSDSLTLKDFDCTIDCEGSFNKEEVIEFMTNHRGFTLQGTQHREKCPGTILNNDAFVGRNCLTYITEINGFQIRCKAYNKFVQCLETKAVRTNIGQHWKDWVDNTGTCLAENRDRAKDRGLTRIEVTFYTRENKNAIPDDELIARTLDDIRSNIPNDLVYSTPYSATWKAFCEIMVHTLVVVERKSVRDEDGKVQNQNQAVIVYSYNEVTGNISGQVISNWDARSKWCLANLTLGGNLPIDVIEVNYHGIISTKKNPGQVYRARKAHLLQHPENPELPLRELYTSDHTVGLSAVRYFRHRENGTTDFKTRIVSTGHSHGTCEVDELQNQWKLTKAGFVATPNCIPDLSGKGRIDNVNVDIVLVRQELLPISVSGHYHGVMIAVKKARIETQFTHFSESLERLREEMKNVEIFQKAQLYKLTDLPRGVFPIYAIKEYGCGPHNMYKVITEFNGEKVQVVSNRSLGDSLDMNMSMKARRDLEESNHGYILDQGTRIGDLVILGYNYTTARHKSVNCYVRLHYGEEPNEINIDIASNMSSPQHSPLRSSQDEMPVSTDPSVCSQKYLELDTLAVLPDNEKIDIISFAYVTYRNKQKLIAKVGDKWYQAGDNVESQMNLIDKDCEIVKLKQRKSRKHGRYEAVVEVKKPRKRSATEDLDSPPSQRLRTQP